MFDVVTFTIPGAKTVMQAEENINCINSPDLSSVTMNNIKIIYETLIREKVHITGN